MKFLTKKKFTLGVNGLLALACLITITIALVTYSVTSPMTPVKQFLVGATADSWNIYVNDVNSVRYLPGGDTAPTLSTGDSSTYAFKVETDANKVCAIAIQLTTAINSNKFSTFQIELKYWSGSAWVDATLYAGATGATTKAFINGLTLNDVGYLHQNTSTTTYYLLEITYSYDLVDETAQVTPTFQYTPMPLSSF
ncbi:MAG: hypothetical protein NWF05_03520 [Candidatus Bathyarchaeota archaeon]|nr:hypothetical protein [Candidatus Bathyarchaeota archaeon]